MPATDHYAARDRRAVRSACSCARSHARLGTPRAAGVTIVCPRQLVGCAKGAATALLMRHSTAAPVHTPRKVRVFAHPKQRRRNGIKANGAGSLPHLPLTILDNSELFLGAIVRTHKLAGALFRGIGRK